MDKSDVHDIIGSTYWVQFKLLVAKETVNFCS